MKSLKRAVTQVLLITNKKSPGAAEIAKGQSLQVRIGSEVRK